MPRSSSRVLALAASAAAALLAASHAFVAAPSRGAAVGAAVGFAGLGAAVPAFAEEAKAPEGLLNFGKVELGGGFAINLDIPETGIINIIVIVAGLFYLLGPILSESMATREKEIQTDIDDAIAKYIEASARLAEAEKNKQQADAVIKEIENSISKDQQDLKLAMETSMKVQVARAAEAAERSMQEMNSGAEEQLEAYILEQAVSRGVAELTLMPASKKAAYLDSVISQL
mmetsp:Transcript_76055/g.246882  ORF Transcript_76055/g.246882 Transcript_76055/m.246882 type:complete len:230 (-) Transcript_76055:102-791(-)